MNAVRSFGLRKYWPALGAIGLLLAAVLSTSRPARAQSPAWVLDRCWGVDHFWDPADYPYVDPNRSDLAGAPSIIILGFTIDLRVVPQGSTLVITFDDGVEVDGTVGPTGKTMVLRGISSYGNYPYVDVVQDSAGNTIESGLQGEVSVDSSEVLSCNEEALSDSLVPPTETPIVTSEPPTATDTLVSMATTAPTVTIDADAPRPPDALVAEETGVFILPLFGPTQEWIVYLCCLALLILGAGGTVVIVIRRRRRRMDTYSNGPSGVDEDLLR